MFIFYDTETTGTNVQFDQILQFAAVLTDKNLNILDQVNLRCRILPWIIPAPGALAVTGTHPAQLDDPGLPSLFQMMASIRSVLERWSPATFVGYNSFKFDEPLLQRAFWQSLHPPYITVSNGNSRLDLLPIVRAATLLPDLDLNIPENESGSPTFKLDLLAPANGYRADIAHDALEDTKATLFLTRKLEQCTPRLWNVVSARSSKRATSDTLTSSEVVLLIDYMFGQANAWWGYRIDENGAAAQHALIARLDENWSKLKSLDNTSFAKKILGPPKLVRQVPLNRPPLFLTMAEAEELLGLSPEQNILSQASVLRSNPDLRIRLCKEVLASDSPIQQSVHLELQIFDGFPSRSDEKRMEEFHASPPEAAVRIGSQFEDKRFRQLAQRIIYTENPELVEPTIRDAFSRSISTRLLSDNPDLSLWRTIPQARRELEELSILRANSELIAEIGSWLDARERNYSLAQ